MSEHPDMSASIGTETLADRLRPVPVGLVKGEFYIPDYQRGYRWTETEVGRLLADVWESDGRPYYLQPIVVRPNGQEWELIDGQQRLTTLFLITQYLHNAGYKKTGATFSLRYQTRQDSAEYLRDPDPQRKRENIDFFHISRAYECIKDWFESHEAPEYAAGKFFNALYERVYLIWYEASATEDPHELFTRLNVGRIVLTDAELAKALILARIRSKPNGTARALAVAGEWDGIERGLRSPEVWAFVTANRHQSATRIDLILDTLADRRLRAENIEPPPSDDRPAYLTFETLRRDIDNSPEKVWDEIADLFSLIQGWHEDVSLFHKIGYLVASRSTSFDDIVGLSNGVSRSGFDQKLDEAMTASLEVSFDELSDLSYESSADYRKLSNALLMFNVETVRALDSETSRYSFSAHGDGSWSLEHVHAQSAEGLRTMEQRRSWLEYHRDALRHLKVNDVSARDELLEAVDAALVDLNAQKFRMLEPQIVDILSRADTEADAVHSISNLALLGARDNSALNNSVFEVKRRAILELDGSGSYVPVATRNVFLKYYTDDENVQIHFWSAGDREGYLSAIHDRLAPYLLKPTTNEEAAS